MKVFALVALIILTTFSKSGIAQIADDEIAGTWRPVKYHTIESSEYPRTSNAEMQKYCSKMFDGAVFVLKTDHSCSLEIPGEPQLGAKKAYWKWDSAKNKLTIGEWEDKNKNYSGGLFLFHLKREGSKTYWAVEETPFILEMEKQKPKTIPQKIKVS